MDNVTPEKRSWMMGRVKGKNTTPERKVRSLLHRSGFRFRLNGKHLPSKPDIILPKYKTVIFVHGCFWHGHEKCKRGTPPSSNVEFWKKKIQLNKERDASAVEALKKLGWRVLIIWECELKRENELGATLKSILADA